MKNRQNGSNGSHARTTTSGSGPAAVAEHHHHTVVDQMNSRDIASQLKRAADAVLTGAVGTLTAGNGRNKDLKTMRELMQRLSTASSNFEAGWRNAERRPGLQVEVRDCLTDLKTARYGTGHEPRWDYKVTSAPHSHNLVAILHQFKQLRLRLTHLIDHPADDRLPQPAAASLAGAK